MREGNRAQASRHSCKEARQDGWLFSLRGMREPLGLCPSTKKSGEKTEKR